MPKSQLDELIANNKELISQIILKLKSYETKQNPHYGHVGDMQKVKDDLEAINQFLKYQPE